jgi:hypothetical protein
MSVNNVNSIFKIWNGYSYCIVYRHFKQVYIYIMTYRELTCEKQNFGRLCYLSALRHHFVWTNTDNKYIFNNCKY